MDLEEVEPVESSLEIEEAIPIESSRLISESRKSFSDGPGSEGSDSPSGGVSSQADNEAEIAPRRSEKPKIVKPRSKLSHFDSFVHKKRDIREFNSQFRWNFFSTKESKLKNRNMVIGATSTRTRLRSKRPVLRLKSWRWSNLQVKILFFGFYNVRESVGWPIAFPSFPTSNEQLRKLIKFKMIYPKF